MPVKPARIFESVLESESALRQALSSNPESVNSTMNRDFLIESIPHWLYVGDTPLHLAAAALAPEAAAVLLNGGANPNAANRRGATPLHYACDPRPKSGGTWNPASQEAVIRLLIQHGANVDRADRDGAVPLHRAVRARSATAVRELLRCGAKIDARLRKSLSTPLHLAVQSTGASGTAGTANEQAEIVALLMESGASPDLKDGNGRSVRDWAGTHPIAEALHRSANRRSR